jgi:hypothetical protein
MDGPLKAFEFRRPAEAGGRGAGSICAPGNLIKINGKLHIFGLLAARIAVVD